MYKKILCPIDGSDSSMKSLNEAIKLTKEMHAQLKFLHIVDTFYPYLDGMELVNFNDVVDHLRLQGREILEHAASLARHEGLEANVDVALCETFSNKIADIILEQATTWGADLIVLGTHGRRGFNHLMLGSDAETVIRGSLIPVLTIRE
ncbi:MAG: universal stress protein [Candidatus Methylopumilus sp.]